MVVTAPGIVEVLRRVPLFAEFDDVDPVGWAVRGKPDIDLHVCPGDLLVFGGASRLACHGVTGGHPFTSPAGCGLHVRRINITMRVTGPSAAGESG